MAQDVSPSVVRRLRFGRAIRRRDAIGLAMLVVLGLTSGDVGWREAGAEEEKEKQTQEIEWGEE